MNESELRDEVLQQTLICKSADATVEDRARLEVLLEDEPRAVPWYVRIVADTFTLATIAARESGRWGFESVGANQATDFDIEGTSIAPVSQPTMRSVFLSAATVCLLLIFIGATWWSTMQEAPSETRSGEPAFARVIALSTMQWSPDSKVFNEWTFVSPGDVVKFDKGQLSLFLSTGAEVLIEGPADVTFASMEKLIARQGKIAARVGPDAVGFSIETPHLNVIDRGTAFGLSVDANSRSAVVVYDGIVDLDILGGEDRARRRLEKGEGLSVDQKGGLNRITSVESAEFLEPPHANRSAAGPGLVIESVNDNIRSLETAKYFRIVPRGFREDCIAYVDRDHEWNGLDSAGLPPFLLGGDYVMTFNDDKIVTDFEMAVTLNQPANLYVLLDDRVPAPEWLKRDFVDTHWDVGSDEGFADRIIDRSVGAGQSIDHVCSVWRRTIAEPGCVTLGALTQEKSSTPALVVERSMYGVVATPLNRDR